MRFLKPILATLAIAAFAVPTLAQMTPAQPAPTQLTAPPAPPAGTPLALPLSPGASVTQTRDDRLRARYSRPGVKGRPIWAPWCRTTRRGARARTRRRRW